MNRRAGTSLVEILVALLLGLFVVQAGVWTVARVRAHHERLMRRSDALAAVRLAGSLLRLETSTGAEGLDWDVSEDALSLRAFRGTGLICGVLSGMDTLVTSFRGYRRPDPSKDSVLLVYPEGDRAVTALSGWVAASDTVCGGSALPGRVVLRLDSSVPVGAVVARVFERGSYALSDGALRYQRGSGGRQPLTPELWMSATGWRRSGPRLEAELIHREAEGWDDEKRWRLPVGPVPP